jgi:hypothetical protein
MRRLVSTFADGALAGLARWYTLRHLGGCAQCRKGLATILAVRGRLRSLSQDHNEDIPLSQERWAAVEAAWEQVDHGHLHSAP